MKKLLVFISVFILSSASSYACVCAPASLVDHLNQSNFVATVKILSIEPDVNKDFHNIEIEIIHVYKGIATSKLKIQSILNSSCGFYTPKGSTWLIFAANDKNNVLSFGYCSGSLQIDKKIDPITFPTGEATYKSNMDIKLSILALLQKKKITNTNPSGLKISSTNDFIDSLGTLGNKKTYSLIEVFVNTDLSIKKVKSLKKFKNPKLKEKLDKLVSNMTFTLSKNKGIPSQTKLYLIYFYYPVGRTEFGYLSTWNL